MLACWNKNEALAALLMEPTKNAGALDLQVNVVWSVWCEGCGQVVGAGAGKGGGAFAQGTDIYMYVPQSTAETGEKRGSRRRCTWQHCATRATQSRPS